MQVNGRTNVFGVIGNPIAHTISPLIHRVLAESEQRNMVYVPFHVTSQLDQAIKGAFHLNIVGMNVTVPYKSEVIDSLLAIDPLAKAIGSVNTLVRRENGYEGYNTDLYGLKRAMESEGITLQGKTIIILGAGGTGRTAGFLCAKEGAKEIYLLNRTLEKAVEIADHVNTYFQRDTIKPMALGDYGKITKEQVVVIQASSVGLSNPEHVIIEDENFYKRVAVGFDIVYQPFETKFIKCVKESGGQAYNGLKMLLYQGVEAYEIWNNCKIPSRVIEDLYEQMKEVMEL
ncbi:MAG: shikimate dehydrogenase [Eubacteriales bacterium]